MYTETGGSGIADSGSFFWQFGQVEFHEGRWELRVDGNAVELERKPLELLAYLLRHANEVVTRSEVMDHVWASRIVVDASLTNAIGKLRKAIGDQDGQVIVTVPRVGYRFSAQVHRRPVAALAPESRLQASDPVPRRTNWTLETKLSSRDASEVWLARHTKTREPRVFKFSLDASGLAGLKREVTLSRYLSEALGPREDLLPASDWDFETAPFFVEYPHGGTNLLEWTEAGGLEQLGESQRLALFLSICDTIAAAHSAGVLHKDIKPANILIEPVSDGLRVRVTDFGSGELLDAERLDALGITRQGLTQVLDRESAEGTPLYIAPELLSGHSPTTRSDVYSLGVLLYQMLTGDLRRPLAAGFAGDVADGLLATDIESAAHGDPQRRPASAAELGTLVRSLDARRMQSQQAQALAERAESAERRLLAERSRRPWLIATGIALAAGVLVASGFALDASRKGGEAKHQLEVTEALSDFLINDIIAAADPVRAGRSDLTVREALDQASGNVTARFPDRPQVAAMIHEAVGRSYHQLAAFDAAIEQFELAISTLESSGQARSPTWIQAKLFEAESLARLGRLDEGRAVLESVQPVLDELPEIPPELVVRQGQTEAQVEFMSMNFIGTIPPLERAAEAVQRIDPFNPRLDYTVRLALLNARSRAGMPQQAEVEGRQIVDELTEVYGPKAPLTLGARHTVLRIVASQGREAEVEHEYVQVVEDLGDVLGANHEVTLLARQGLMHVLSKVERWPDVERLGRELVDMHTARVGAHGIHTLATANGVGLAKLRQGQTEQGVAYLQEHLARSLETLGDGHPVSTALRLNMAYGHLELGRRAPARELIEAVEEHGGMFLQLETDAAGELALLNGWLAWLEGRATDARAHLELAQEHLLKKNAMDYWLLQQTRQLLERLN